MKLRSKILLGVFIVVYWAAMIGMHASAGESNTIEFRESNPDLYRAYYSGTDTQFSVSDSWSTGSVAIGIVNAEAQVSYLISIGAVFDNSKNIEIINIAGQVEQELFYNGSYWQSVQWVAASGGNPQYFEVTNTIPGDPALTMEVTETPMETVEEPMEIIEETTETVTIIEDTEAHIPSYMKKDSTEDKIINAITDTYKEINSIGDLNRIVDNYGKVYVEIPLNDNFTIQYKNEYGEEYTGIKWSKSF